MISLEQEIEKRRKIVEEKGHKVAEANRAVIDAEYDINKVTKELAELVAKRDTLTAHLTEAKKNLEEVKAINVSKIEAELDMLDEILMEQKQEEEVMRETPIKELEVEQPVECEECVIVPEKVEEIVEEPVIEYVPEELKFVETPVIEEQRVEKQVNGDPFGTSIDRVNF